MRTDAETRRKIQSGKYRPIDFCNKKNPLHINYSTYYVWKKRDFVEDDKPGRHKNGYKKQLTEEQEQKICELRVKQEYYGLPITEFHNIIKEEYPCSYKVLWKLLTKHGLVRKPKEKHEGTFGDTPEGYLHIDVTYMPYINGKKSYLFVAIDRKTRLAYWELYDRKTVENTIDFAQKCRQFYPFPIYHILTDNGKEFSAKFSKDWCSSHAITYSHTKPYTPQTNGMVERLNGTIKKELIHRQRFSSIMRLNKCLKEYQDYYNNKRRHSSIQATPVEVGRNLGYAV